MTTIDYSSRLELARGLVKAIEAGDNGEAERLLDEITAERDSNLFQQLGKLTRELHEALSNFQFDARIAHMASEEIPDARERLNYVVAMTEEAAHKTLGAVERSLPVAERIGGGARSLNEAWRRFRAKQMSAEEFRELTRELDDFLERVASDSDAIRQELNTVMMAQGTQDLSGQIIRRVVQLVQELEEKLVELVRITGMRLHSGEQQTSDRQANGAGPAVPGLDQGVVKSQDEVDDLLSSLGF